MGKFYAELFPRRGYGASVRLLSRKLGFTEEYLFGKPKKWVEEELKRIAEEDILEKRWQMTLSRLSHTPMTKEAGKSYQDSVRDIDKHFERQLNVIKRSSDEFKREMRMPIKSSVKVILDPREKDTYHVKNVGGLDAE